ncbi:MAG: RidA family protein [Burkholderiales bacterium]|nr:RidA family protein [Burkholderiales bacterium]
MPKKFVNPSGLKQIGTYSHVVLAPTGSSLAFISGQVAIDSQGNIVGKGDIEAQAVQVFENIKLALGGVGATFDDIVKFTIYVVGLTQERRKAVMDVRGRYINNSYPPAATMVGVEALVQTEFLVEIEATVAITN